MSKGLTSRRSFLTISAMTAASLVLDWKRIDSYAATMGDKSQYPTVIIGAGLGGLCCGAYLAKQGIPVTVVEHHDKPGGYATSFGRAGGKFSFEVSLHGTAAHNTGTGRILNDLGVLDHIELVELPEFYRLKTPTLDISIPQRDPEAFIRLLSEYFPAEEAGIRGLVNEMVALAEEVDKLDRKQGRFFKPLFPLTYRRMWNIRNKTLADVMNEYVKDPALRDALASLWGYYGLPPAKLSGFYYSIATGEYLKHGSYYIKKRSQDLSNALVRAIESSGGKVRYGTLAQKILVEKGAVRGVEIAGGEVVPARTVVSNASAITTFREMLPQEVVPADYLKKLESYRPSISSFLVWLGLNQEVRGKIRGCGIYVTSGRGPEADYESCLKGEVDKGFYGVSVYDNAYDGYSKPGTSSIVLIFLTGYEPWRKFEADYRAGRKDSYYKEKDRWRDILIRRAETEIIPGLSSMIEIKEAATPLTNWRYTRNTEGAIYGFEQSMNNAFMTRIDNRTPIKGLYLASAWGNPGGGYGGVLGGGQQTFLKIMEDWGKA